jgi:2-octaprenyl-6-methoxyphenol hydroxylase
VCDIKHQENHHGIAVERFLQKGPFAILPKKGGHTSSIVWTIPDEYHQTLSSLPEAQLIGLIAKRFDDIFGTLELASSIKFFKLDRVLAKKYFKNRVVLIGDALHTLHPLAGQGLNLSLRDVDLLVDKIKERHALGLDIGSSIMLQEFQKERLPDNNIMSEATHFLNSIFAYDFEIIKFARRFGMRFVNECTPLNNALMKYAARGEI